MLSVLEANGTFHGVRLRCAILMLCASIKSALCKSEMKRNSVPSPYDDVYYGCLSNLMLLLHCTPINKLPVAFFSIRQSGAF